MQFQQFRGSIRSYERFTSGRVILFQNHLFLEHSFCLLPGVWAERLTVVAPAGFLEQSVSAVVGLFSGSQAMLRRWLVSPIPTEDPPGPAEAREHAIRPPPTAEGSYANWKSKLRTARVLPVLSLAGRQ